MSHTPADPAALDALEVLSQLIAIDSVNSDLVPGGAGESAIADWCAAWLTDHGLEVTRLEARAGHPSLVAIARGTGGGATLLLNGHLDTVGVAGYDGDPFSGTRETVDGAERVVGRGAFDTKSGLAAVMVATARALADGALRGDAVLTLVADEEFGSTGTVETLAHLAATGVRPDAAVAGQNLVLLSTPSFEEARLDLGDARFEIVTRGFREPHRDAPPQYVQGVQLDGASLERPWLTGHELHRGGQLVVALGDAPSGWGTSIRPPSMPHPAPASTPADHDRRSTP
ncbi:MAG: M20/M25/M40 family metallo-hydrolase [Microcella pacifica]